MFPRNTMSAAKRAVGFTLATLTIAASAATLTVASLSTLVTLTGVAFVSAPAYAAPAAGGVPAALGAPAAAASPATPDLTLNLPGDSATPLSDIGYYRVGFKLGGGKEQWMPDGWTGVFDAANGVSYSMFGRQNGKDALFIHSPWRKTSGVTFVDYRLAWPADATLAFSFSSAIKSEFVGKSDGVSYRVYVDGKKALEYLEKAGAWVPHSVDISAASKERGHATVRVEVQPGPAGDPSFDYSLFGDPQFVVSGGATASASLSRAASGTTSGAAAAAPAVTAAATGAAVATTSAPPALTGEASSQSQAHLVPPFAAFANKSDRGTRPSADLAGTNAAAVASDGSLLLTFRDPGAGGIASIDYVVSTVTGQGLLQGVQAIVNGATVVPVFSGAGLSAPCSLLKAELVRDSAVLTYSMTAAKAAPVTVVVTLKPAGKSLQVDIDSPAGPQRVALGSVGLVPRRRALVVPYLDSCSISLLPDYALFCAMGQDWSVSNATYLDGLDAVYDPKTDGSRNPVHERAYVTLSDRLEEVLPNIPNAPSPYLADLAGRLVVDLWGGSFADNAELLRMYRGYGVTAPAVLLHDWQRDGYDNGLPNHVPASEEKGGSADMLDFVRVGKSMGARVALHENYIDMYKNSDYYSDAAIALNSDRSKQLAWLNEGTGQQSLAMKGTAAIAYARKESPQILKLYGTNSVFLDVNSSTTPWFHVDMAASEPLAGSMESRRRTNAELFAFERQVHAGPLFGEGRLHQYWAGQVDGVEAQVDGGEDTPVLADFDLLKIHPLALNHGMGYLSRWLNGDHTDLSWPGGEDSDAALDRYRATTLAYGHAGFVDTRTASDTVSVARDYYLTSPIQPLYGTSPATEVLYADATGQLRTASQALLAGTLTDRIRLTYASGLRVWVNRSDVPWTLPAAPVGPAPVVGSGAMPVVLPAGGFIATGPDVVAATVSAGGHSVDYSVSRGVAYADSRGAAAADFGWLKVDGSVVIRAAGTGLRFVPCPRGEPATVTISLADLPQGLSTPGAKPAAAPASIKVVARNADGKVLRAVPFEYNRAKGLLTLTVGGYDGGDAFDYLATLR